MASPMEAIINERMREIRAKKKTNVPWTPDTPHRQSYHIYTPDQEEWISLDPSTSPSQLHTHSLTRLALYSWNIDFMLPFADSRMHAALNHLRHEHIDKLDAQTASVIYLQECVESDLRLLVADPWVRSTFSLSDLDTQNWGSGFYGTVTLVDLRLPVTNSFRVHYAQTRWERDAFFVDIRLSSSSKPVRLCNSHLDSLAFQPPYRGKQMEVAARYMHDAAVQGAVAAGDFNAIEEFDLQLHAANGLKDAYLELGGKESDSVGGHTWGQQAARFQREKFGTTRMDKVYFCGGVRCVAFERFGAGVEVEDEGERSQLVELGFDRPWITDHLGVKGVFELE